jgi:hypothetical protein
MNHYPAGLFAVVGRAPGVEYQPRAHGLEYVLKYLDEYAEHPKAASDLVEFVNKKNYAEVFWVLRGTNRRCLDHAAAALRWNCMRIVTRWIRLPVQNQSCLFICTHAIS